MKIRYRGVFGDIRVSELVETELGYGVVVTNEEDAPAREDTFASYPLEGDWGVETKVLNHVSVLEDEPDFKASNYRVLYIFA